MSIPQKETKYSNLFYCLPGFIPGPPALGEKADCTSRKGDPRLRGDDIRG